MKALQLGEIVRDHQPFAGSVASIHVLGVAGNGREPDRLREAAHVHGNEHHRRVPKHDAGVADHLHPLDTRHGRNLRAHLLRESNRPDGEVL